MIFSHTPTDLRYDVNKLNYMIEVPGINQSLNLSLDVHSLRTLHVSFKEKAEQFTALIIHQNICVSTVVEIA